MADKLFCGIEGGASVSKLTLLNGSGKVLCTLEGPAANHLLVGQEECQKRLADMIEKAKEASGFNSKIVIDSLGLCMSGCEEDEANREFERYFLRRHPAMVKSCTVASDTVGPLFTASPEGGLVLIAGTGSNSLLINPDQTTARCGGWGHLIGDEGSAMWIALKAVKTVFDHEDNLNLCPFDITRVKEIMLHYFKVSHDETFDGKHTSPKKLVNDKFGVLEYCYSNFNKSFFAGICQKLAIAATEEKDALCCHLFYEAGKALGSMAAALKPKVHPSLLERKGGLPIVCVGSVFKSWHLLEKGFKDSISKQYDQCTLVTLNCSAAVGAAFLGAKAVGFNLPVDYSNNTSVLYSYKS